MCTGAEVGLILAGAGTAAGAYNQDRALRKQDRAAAEGLRRQAEMQRQASGRAMQHIGEFAQSSPAAEQRQSADAYMNAIRAARPSTEGSLQAGPGAAPARFAEDVSAGRDLLATEGAGRASRMATIDAPMLQRLREGQQFNTAATDIGELERRSQAEDFLTRLRVSGIRPNPWVGAASSIARGVGGAMALMPAGAAAGTPVTAAAAAPGGMTADTLNWLRRMNNPFHAPGNITSVLGGP